MQIRTMQEIARDVVILMPGVASVLPNCLVGDNFEATSDHVMVGARQWLYGEKAVDWDPISLISFPEGTKLCGGKHFVVACGDYIVSEQIPPKEQIRDQQELEALIDQERPEIQIAEDCLLVSRYGIMTWGHWLGELFPRALIAERLFPGRFFYVLPQDIFNGDAIRNVWNSIFETLKSVGIGRDRILPCRYDNNYKFRRLHCIAGTQKREEFHPAFIKLMHEQFFETRHKFPRRRVALLRTESIARNISNIADVAGVLRDHDFEFVEIAKLPFCEQVNLFSTAYIVAGVLGSGLSGLLYCAPQIKVLSMGPEGYTNAFFYSMIRHARGEYYDVRGEITKRDHRADHFSDYKIDRRHLVQGLEALGIEKVSPRVMG